VTIVDRGTTWIEHGVSFGCETVVHPFSFIGAGAVVGESCRLGPFAYVRRGERIPSGTAVGPVTERRSPVVGGRGVVISGGKQES
jgi:UDP-3-O-[3-hydroxymyristoyl] glucosamine N-acyltransferase